MNLMQVLFRKLLSMLTELAKSIVGSSGVCLLEMFTQVVVISSNLVLKSVITNRELPFKGRLLD